jgi:hypothetical protein
VVAVVSVYCHQTRIVKALIPIDVAQADKSEEKLCSQAQSSTRKLKRKIKLSFNDNIILTLFTFSSEALWLVKGNK